MTVKENTSPTIMMQILFWDVIILLMSTVQKARQRFSRPQREPGFNNNPLKTIVIILVCLALGLYAGVLLGYFGI